MATNEIQTTPFRAVHPTEIIKDELKARSMSQKELAERMGLQAPNVTRLLKGENITTSIARKLEVALDIPADFWMRLQTQYDRDIESVAARNEAEKEAIVAEKTLAGILNLNEIYRLADKYAKNEEKYYSIIRKAYMLYPNDSYINLTMACLAIKKGEADEAEEYLRKVDNSPEKTMNEGLIAWMRGDADKAIQLVEQARQQGVRQAEVQLQEFAKLKKQ